MWNHVSNSEFSQSNIGCPLGAPSSHFILRTTDTQVRASKDTLEHENESQRAKSHFVSEGLQPFEPILLEFNENCSELARETRRSDKTREIRRSDKTHTCHFTIRTERIRSRRHQTPHWPAQGPVWVKISICIHPACNMFILCFQTALRHCQTKEQHSILEIRRTYSIHSTMTKITLVNVSAIRRLFTMKQARHNDLCVRIHNRHTMLARARAHSEHFP